jgi:ligand-binding sensor domain-containing protein
MKKYLYLSIVMALGMTLGARARGADEDWTVFLNSSAVYRATIVGEDLWCSTSGGILLFDLADSTFTHYYNGLGFPSTEVRDVAEGDGGSLWVGFEADGIMRIVGLDNDPVTTRFDELHTELLSDSITCLLAVPDGVYYGSTEGVGKIEGNDHVLEQHLSDSLAGATIHDLLLRSDTLWVASDDGIAIYDRQGSTFTFFRIGRALSICEHEGSIFAAGQDAVLKYSGSGWEQVGSALNGAPLVVASGGGELACITEAYIYRWNGSYWSGVDNGGLKTLQHNLYRSGWADLLRALIVDDQGTLWVGGKLSYTNRGVYLNGYVGGVWRSWAPSQPSYNYIVELAGGADGGIWISTNAFGIGYRTATGHWTNYTRLRSDWGDEALSYFGNNLAMLFDSKGYLWCNALDFDLDRIEINDPIMTSDDVWDHYALGEGTITSERFIKAKEDPADNRWFLSDDDYESEGQYGINIKGADPGEGWLSVNPGNEPGMKGGRVVDCAFDGTGGVYLAIGDYGVQLWITGGYSWSSLSNLENDVWVSLIEADDLASTILYSIARDEDGAIYLGTSSGLVQYREGLIDSIPKKNSAGEEGLIGSIVYDVEFDGAGNLWIATDGGLNMLDREGNIDAFTSFDHWRTELQFIYSSDVISPLPNHICKALQYDPVLDALWIATQNGLVRLDVSPPPPERIDLSELILYPNPVHISRGDEELRIGRVSGVVSIKVFTVTGELVHEAAGLEEDDVAWDLLTINGFRVRSGIYIVRIETEGHSEIRKVAVIR